MNLSELKIGFVPYGDLAALERAMGPDVAAILIEPIQGIAGVRPMPPGYLTACRSLCDLHGVPLVLDDTIDAAFVPTGNGLSPDQARRPERDSAIAEGLRLLLENPDQMALVLEDEERIPNMIEEMAPPYMAP